MREDYILFNQEVEKLATFLKIIGEDAFLFSTLGEQLKNQGLKCWWIRNRIKGIL